MPLTERVSQYFHEATNGLAAIEPRAAAILMLSGGITLDAWPLLRRTESPIEQILGAALYVQEPAFDAREGAYSSLWPQMPLNVGGSSYRADFALRVYPGEADAPNPKRRVEIAIEADGAEWHEKTPEQAKRDKRRDREFQAHGLWVLRFTGAEIWKEPLRVAGDVYGFAAEKIRELKAAG